MTFQLGSFTEMQKVIDDFEAQGYSALQVLLQLNDVFTNHDSQEKFHPEVSLDQLQRAALCQCLAEVDSALTDGASEKLQLLALGSKAIKVFGGQKKCGSLFE